MDTKRRDGGWGWLIVAGSLLVGVIVDGIKYSFGILYIELLDTFRASKTETSWIISIQVGISYFTGPVTGALVNRFGCRKVAMVGSLISFVGFVISPFATSTYYLYVSFGVLGGKTGTTVVSNKAGFVKVDGGTSLVSSRFPGLGFGMMMLPFCVTIVRYFDKYLAFATGLSAMGPGLGTIIFNPLTKILLDRYSWRGTLLVEAGLVLNGLVCGAIIRMPDSHPDSKTGEQTDEPFIRNSEDKKHGIVPVDDYSRLSYDTPGGASEQTKYSLIELQEMNNYSKTIPTKERHSKPPPGQRNDSKQTTHHWFTIKPLKNVGFLLLMLSTVLVELSLIVPFSYLPDMMKTEDYTRSQAVWIIFIIGICSTISRVIAGAVGDIKYVNRVVLCVVCIIWTGVAEGFFPLCSDYTSYIGLAVVFGIGAGSSCSLRGILIPELFGVDKIADCMGISMFFSGAAAFISLPLAGLITDISGSYTLSFIIAGIEMVCGGALIGIILCIKDHKI